MRAAAPVILLVLALFPGAAALASIDRCGVYEVEGFLDKRAGAGEPSLYLLLDQGSRSEIRVKLGNYTPDFQNKVGTHIRASVRIDAPCFRDCQGKLEGEPGVLEPDAIPRAFQVPGFKPVAERPCR